MATAQIAKRVGKSSRKNFHRNSIYNALRILVRRGTLQVTRKGHEKLYRVGGGAPAVAATSGPAPVRSSAPRAPRKTAAATSAAPTSAAAGSLPHRLGLGDILVLEVGERYVLTATNLHGKLIVERVTVS
ncbi:MAG TPA: hypothetical protein VFF67_09395 [Thermoplasmata archaeon]|nr:hypothetical protein [Thermoplasmata archaeon]